MNILMVTPFFPPQTGGVVTYVECLQRLLRERGHSVYVLTPGSFDCITPRSERMYADVYEVYLRKPWVPEAPMKGYCAFVLYWVPTLVRLMRFAKSKAIDLILLEYPLAYMHYFTLLKRLTGVKVIAGLHGSDILSLNLWPVHERFIVKEIVRRADWVLTHSASLMLQTEQAIQRLGSNRSYISYGIESTKMRNLAQRGTQNRRHPTRDFVLTVAKLHPRKGLDVLLHAISQLSSEGNQHVFVVVGDGPEEETLKYLSRSLGIEREVVFTGELQHQEIAKLYEQCSFFVLPSRSEPFGIALLEAMSFGKAIVATRVGGIPEFLIDGFNGFLVDPDDTASLAKGIRMLTNDRDLRVRIGRNGYDLVEKQYRYESIIDEYESLFRKVIGS